MKRSWPGDVIRLSLSRAGERWAVLVNEFGALGIDGALLHGAGGDEGEVIVREVAGGCMCCAGGMPLAVTIAQVSPPRGGVRNPLVRRAVSGGGSPKGGLPRGGLNAPYGSALTGGSAAAPVAGRLQLLRQAKPHRLLVEPSGLGHPAGLVDAIRGEHLKTALDLRAVICLVDPRLVAAGDELLSYQGFVDQVKLGSSATMRFAYADSTMLPRSDATALKAKAL